MKRLYLALAVLLVAILLIWSSVFVINEREQALVYRFGEIKRVIREPGLYFKIPTNLVETVQVIEDRLLRFEIEDLRVQVSDSRRYLVDAFVAFKIVDPLEFRQSVGGSLDLLVNNLETRANSALRRVYGQRSFEAALSAQRAEMMREVRDELRPLSDDLGVEIVDVRIRRTDLLPEVSQQTFERMQAERLAEAAELRAAGTQEKLRIEAEADREAVTTIAGAQRDAEILRGSGDAERNRVFAQAFTRDPDFFEFYRSMKAYEEAIEDSDTTLVLTPDSEFFRFFRDPLGGDVGTPSARRSTPAPRVDVPAAGGFSLDDSAAGDGVPSDVEATADPVRDTGVVDAPNADLPSEAVEIDDERAEPDVLRMEADDETTIVPIEPSGEERAIQ